MQLFLFIEGHLLSFPLDICFNVKGHNFAVYEEAFSSGCTNHNKWPYKGIGAISLPLRHFIEENLQWSVHNELYSYVVWENEYVLWRMKAT